jgi:polyketide biosynthesis enoyl-CoA hydratase PksH
MTKPILVEQAHAWGLVDAYDAESESLLRRHLLRLKRLPGTGIARYKRYMSGLQDIIVRSKPMAVGANREIFSDPRNLSWISQYVEKGQFPWEN